MSTALFNTLIHANRALVDRLQHTLFTIFDSADRTFGSGVGIDVGGRLLIATAAHVVKDHKDKIDVVHPILGRSKPLQIVDVQVGDPDDDDIAFVHVDARSTSATAVQLHQLDVGVPIVAGEPYIVFGNPTDMIDPLNNQTFVVSPIAFMSFPFPRARWPARCHDDRDLLLSYKAGETAHANGGADVVDAPKPPGLSGGAIWRCGLQKGMVWTADNPRLAAIQHSWNEHEKYVRGTRIDRWLDFVADRLPVAREAIIAAFPALRSRRGSGR